MMERLNLISGGLGWLIWSLGKEFSSINWWLTSGMRSLIELGTSHPSMYLGRREESIYQDPGDGSQIGSGTRLDRWMTRRVSSKTQIQLFWVKLIRNLSAKTVSLQSTKRKYCERQNWTLLNYIEFWVDYVYFLSFHLYFLPI